MNTFRIASLAAVLALTVVTLASPAYAIDVAPACAIADLSLAVRPSDGDGGPYGAAFLTLKNTSTTACSIPGHPHVSLYDSKGDAIVSGASTGPVVGMHPGPVIVPRNLAAGASLGTCIRWLRVASDPATATCANVSTVDLEGAQTDLATTICGDATTGRPHLGVALYSAPD